MSAPVQHATVPKEHMHDPYRWIVADDAARLALSVLSIDVGKWLRQTGDNTTWELINDSPVEWANRGVPGGYGTAALEDVSETAAAAKVPISDANGLIDDAWLHNRTFNTVAEMVADTDIKLSQTIGVYDYATGNNSGILFFKAVAAGTGTADGGSYIDSVGVPGIQFQQNFPAIISVKSFGDNIQSAITYAAANDLMLDWKSDDYVTTSSLTSMHSVKHKGQGRIIRGTDTFYVSPDEGQLNKLYVDSTIGSDLNDGLSAAQPFLTIQKAIDVIEKYKPIISRWQTHIAAGIYNENLIFPDGLSAGKNYLEFKCPSTPGVQGDPATWPASGVRLDGTGLGSIGISVGRYNKIYFEYLLIENWFQIGTPAIDQIYRGVVVDEFSFAYFYGCSAQGNGIDSFAVTPQGGAVITGGVIDGGRRSVDNTGGSLSFTSDRVTNFTTLKNGLEYGLYAKHDSRTVIDGAHFEDCGNVTGAEEYGAAIFAYKSNTSVDVKGCTYNRNNHCYNVRGGSLARDPGLSEVYGTGADANARVWKINGFGEDDLINYKSISGRELQIDFASQTTSSASLVDVVENSVDVPAGYFTDTKQYLEITIRGVNDGGGTAQVRPVLQSDAPNNYPLSTFDIAALSFFEIKIIVVPTSPSTQKIFFNCTNATSSGNSIEDATQALPADTNGWYFKVQGSVTSGSLTFIHASCKMWG